MANGKNGGCGTRISLDNRETFSLPRRSRCREIVCIDGVIWVTFSGDRKDYLLGKGERVRAAGDAGAVISAIGRSEFSLVQDDEAAARPALRGLAGVYAA
jgi:hypothetical protein